MFYHSLWFFLLMLSMVIKAYNNGSYSQTGSGYGFRIKKSDIRDNLDIFTQTIFLTLDTKLKKIPIFINQDSVQFGDCGIFTKKEIGEWLILNGMRKWKEGNPPEFLMKYDGNNHFKIQKLEQ